MSEDPIPEGVITQGEIAELAVLFDRFEFAFDPRSLSAKEAESDFEAKVKQLFDARVATQYPNVDFATFHCRIRSLCRVFLKKERALATIRRFENHAHGLRQASLSPRLLCWLRAGCV